MYDSWHSYPSIFALGHRVLKELLLDPVTTEEKIDGSQFSFGLFEVPIACDQGHYGHSEYDLRFRSKGAQLNAEAPEKMFIQGVEAVKAIKDKLHVGWTYRGEYLKVPKHNALAYDRTPTNHIMIFDINDGQESYLPYAEKKAEAERLGFECVPLIHEGMIETPEQFREMLNRVSVLGGQKIEGVVIKNYRRFGPDKKALLGKFVSEHFKEIHAAEWKGSNPHTKDILDRIVDSLRTPARWHKAVQHLRERGLITDSPKDIGLVIKEVQEDIRKECMEYIAEKLVEFAMPSVMRGVIKGCPEWYKEELVSLQFNQNSVVVDEVSSFPPQKEPDVTSA